MSDTQCTEAANKWNKHFLKWAEQFRSKHTYVDDPDSETGNVRIPLYAVLEPIKKMRVRVKDVACLEMNLLYACYQAAHSKPPEDYSTSIARRKWEVNELSLQAQQKYVDSLCSYSIRNQTVVGNCFARASKMPREGRHTVDASAEDKAEIFQALLAEYAWGLKRVIKSPVIMGVDAKFGFGPFAYDKDAEEIEKRDRPDVITLGLCFNLVYLFRYFTAESLPSESSELFDIQPEFFGNELKFRGNMLEVGIPNYRTVAALVNATLKTRLSTDDIKLRLKDLLRPPKKVSPKLAGRKRDIEFFGWEVNIPT